MAKSLTVNGYTFEFPENRDSPGWGEEATSWAEAVTDVCAEVNGQGDISQSISNIDNNTLVNPDPNKIKDVVGFFIDPAVVRGAVCDYCIYRKTDSAEKVEVGQLLIGYKSTGFDVVQVGGGLAGVVLTILPSGQVQYSSDNVSGSNYQGYIKFRARALTQF